MKKESAFYLEQVELGKRLERMREKKEARLEKEGDIGEKRKQFAAHNKERREFKQRKPILPGD